MASPDAIDFSRYDAIPVSRHGAGEAVPPLADFADLRTELPSFAAANLLSDGVDDTWWARLIPLR